MLPKEVIHPVRDVTFWLITAGNTTTLLLVSSILLRVITEKPPVFLLIISASSEVQKNKPDTTEVSEKALTAVVTGRFQSSFRSSIDPTMVKWGRTQPRVRS